MIRKIKNRIAQIHSGAPGDQQHVERSRKLFHETPAPTVRLPLQGIHGKHPQNQRRRQSECQHNQSAQFQRAADHRTPEKTKRQHQITNSKHFGGIHPAPERSGGIKKPAAFRKFFRIAFAVFNPFCDRPQNQEQQ